jgi:hypothetical protein
MDAYIPSQIQEDPDLGDKGRCKNLKHLEGDRFFGTLELLNATFQPIGRRAFGEVGL